MLFVEEETPKKILIGPNYKGPGHYQYHPLGFVELVDYMGTVERIVSIAGVSYGKNEDAPEESPEDAEKRRVRIINTLLTKKHLSPFEHLVFTFHIKLPIFVMRQLARHRIASINEKSGRYTQFDRQEFWMPDWERMDPEIAADLSDGYVVAHHIYNKLLRKGVPRELARTVLPVASYTEIYWTINARSLMNFFEQRLDPQAQYEMREYARAVYMLVSKQFPLIFHDNSSTPT